MRAAAAITSITMNGGTSLRCDAVSRPLARSLNVASSIDICYFEVPAGAAVNRSWEPEVGQRRWKHGFTPALSVSVDRLGGCRKVARTSKNRAIGASD